MLRGEIFIWLIWRNIEEELRWNMDNGVMLCDCMVIYISWFWEVCFCFILTVRRIIPDTCIPNNYFCPDLV